MIYYAMIGQIPYLEVSATDDDHARAKFALMFGQCGGGLYRRWRDAGMAVRVKQPTREEKRNVRTEDRVEALRVQIQRV